MIFLMLLAGLALLLISGEYLVRGGVSLAGHMKISTLVVGVTVVSFGTSAPELVVSLDATFSGHPDISLGNVVGSNFSNIGLVLALTVIIAPYYVNTRSVLFDWLTMMTVTLLLGLMLVDLRLSRIEGIILLVLIFVFIFWSIRKSRRDIKGGSGKYPEVRFSLPLSLVIIFISCLGLVLGADLLVGSVTQLARMLGISERIISITVIALGTSLPELATSVMAAMRKENEISIGNILGSNIFNILAILGATAAINPFSVADPRFRIDMIWVTGISLLIFILILPVKGAVLTRWKGFMLALIYFTYIYLVFFVR